MRNPAVFLETAGLSALPTPTGLFLLAQQPLSESPKLPALRADVSAKVRARHLGFLLLSRRGVQNPSILTIFSVFPHLPQAAGLVHSAAPPLKIAIALLDCDFVFFAHVGATWAFSAAPHTPLAVGAESRTQRRHAPHGTVQALGTPAGSIGSIFSTVGRSAPSTLFRQTRRSPLLFRNETKMPFCLRVSTLFRI